MKSKVILIISISLIFLCPKEYSFSQFTRYLPGGLAGALGGAYVSIADDESGIFYNPAGLSKLKSPKLAFSSTAWNNLFNEILSGKPGLGDFKQFSFFMPLTNTSTGREILSSSFLDKTSSVVGLSVGFSSANLIPRNVQNKNNFDYYYEICELTPLISTIILTYANDFSKVIFKSLDNSISFAPMSNSSSSNLSLGANVKYLRYYKDLVNKNKLTIPSKDIINDLQFDVGILYNMDSSNNSFGCSLQNIGYSVFSKNNSASIPAVFRIGISTDFDFIFDHKDPKSLLFSCDINSDGKRSWFCIGGKYVFKTLTFLRMNDTDFTSEFDFLLAYNSLQGFVVSLGHSLEYNKIYADIFCSLWDLPFILNLDNTEIFQLTLAIRYNF